MSTDAWAKLAENAPFFLIFAGVLYMLIVFQSKNLKEQMAQQSNDIKELVDKFMGYMDKRDKALTDSINHIANCLSTHDEQAKVIMHEARGHDSFVREHFGKLE